MSAISACQLDTRPQAVGVAGLGQDPCTAHGICDSGVATGVSGKSGASGVAGHAVGSGGMGAVGTAGMTPMNGGVGGAGGTSTTQPMLDVGHACTNDLQCKTAHCDGVCCAAGDCCATVADCTPTTVGGIQILCNDPGTCQGSGGAIQCVNSRCAATGAPNDSACSSTTVANSCGAYLPVYCNGMAEQQAPTCPMSCQSNANCKPNAHCDGTCVLNVDNGGACRKDADCTSTHCNNGICCASGDCCSAAAQCPPSYTGAPTCDTAATCQGTRKQPVCTNFQCSSELAPDDTGCGTTVLANDCGAKADQFCKGTKNQTNPTCGGNNCAGDAQCDVGAYCQTTETPSTCKPKQANATSCMTNSMCMSNSCSLANMLCCNDTNGQCCSVNSDCMGSTYSGMTCTNPATCMGTILTPKCRTGTCGADPTADTTPCNGMVHQCTAGYLPATCPAPCKTTCSATSDCAAGYMCIGAACQIPVPVAGTSAATGGTGGTSGVIALPMAGTLGLPL